MIETSYSNILFFGIITALENSSYAAFKSPKH